MDIGVRFSAYDFIPFYKGPYGVGLLEIKRPGESYPYAFGGDGSGLGIDLSEPVALTTSVVSSQY
jgi:hypothetical protein